MGEAIKPRPADRVRRPVQVAPWGAWIGHGAQLQAVRLDLKAKALVLEISQGQQSRQVLRRERLIDAKRADSMARAERRKQPRKRSAKAA